MIPPITTRFRLGPRIGDSERAFLDRYGFLHYEGVATRAEVDRLLEALGRAERRLLAERPRHVQGIPIRYGRDLDGRPIVQRFAFTTHFSDELARFVSDARLAPLTELLGPDGRFGVHEKDGLVVNHYLAPGSSPAPGARRGSRYRRLGWHTDGLRDIFLHRRLPAPMLNVGFHLDDSPCQKGGLRLIPGSHKQGLLAMMFGKLYFLDNRPDPREHAVEARAGDLTVHDGRLWHRAAPATVSGEASRRRVMYMPLIDGPYEPKHAASPVPIYHRLGFLVG
jgi:hypothetical protein